MAVVWSMIGATTLAAYSLIASLGALVAAWSGNEAAGAVAGAVGATILSGVGVQVMRTFRAQQGVNQQIITGLREENADLRAAAREDRARLREEQLRVDVVAAENLVLKGRIELLEARNG